MRPDSEDHDYHVLAPGPTAQIDKEYGQEVGQVYRLHYETDDEYEDMKLTKRNTWISNLFSRLPAWLSREITYRKFSFMYAAKECANNEVEFTAAYEQSPNSNNPDSEEQQIRKHKSRRSRSVKNSHGRHQDSSENSEENPAIPHNYDPDNEERRQQYLHVSRNQAGNATSSVIDLSMNFHGNKPFNHVFTAAYAKSLVNESATYLVFYNKDANKKPKRQVCLFANFLNPQVPLVNFLEAVQFNPNSNAKVLMNAGDTCDKGAQARLRGKLMRTNDYVDFIQKWPLSKECVADINRNHTYLFRDCQNVTYHAEDLKAYTFNISYDDNFPDFIKDPVYKAYSFVQHRYYRHVDEQIVRSEDVQPNHINIATQMNNISTVFYMDIVTPSRRSTFNYVPLSRWEGDMLTANPRTSMARRVYNYLLPFYNLPTCVIDVNLISTFDNATFYNHLKDDEYKVMELREPTISLKNIDVSMKVQDQNRDVKIVAGDVHVDLKHSSDKPEVYFQNQKIKYSNDYATPLQVGHQVIGHVYGLPKRSVMVKLTQNQVSFVYDNQRFLVQASNIYRNKTRGLCSNMDGESVTDTLTPRECYAISAQDFIASYSQHSKPDLNRKNCIQLFPNERMRVMRPRLLDADLSSALSSSSSSSSSSSKGHSSSSSSESVENSKEHNSRSSSSSSSSASSSSSSRHSSSSSSSRTSDNSNSHSQTNSRSSSSDSSSSRSRSRTGHHSSSASRTSSSSQSSSSSSETNESIHPKDRSHQSNTVRPNILRKQNMAAVTKVIRREKEVCFSIKLLPTCIDSSHAADTRVQQEQFVCLPESPAAEHYLKLIKKGVNPDLSRKKNVIQLEVKIPLKCVKN